LTRSSSDLRFGSRPLGLDFLAELKADPATAEIPVLVCSADLFEVRAARRTLTDAGCSALLKPYRLDELLAAVVCRLAEVVPCPCVDAA
jgi:CheY-like chemotaxis protein